MKKVIYLLAIVALFHLACKKSGTIPEPNPTPTIPTTPTPTSYPLPAAAKDGVVFINGGTSAIVTLYAPSKTSVYVIGDFSNWQTLPANQLKLAPDNNTWWVQIDGLDPNTEYAYQFMVDGSLKVADPYCEKVLDPNNDSFISASVYPGLKTYPTGKTTGIVSVMQANKPVYAWKNNSFVRPDKNNLVIYELLIRDFTNEHTYASTLQKLDYLVSLGINAIELMPITEFEGNISWGYNISYAMAPDKYYGTKAALQNFIDECHGKGIAVIMDMVLNHAFGQSPMVQLYFDGNKPTANSPWFNVDAKHPYNVGYDFNHESAATKYYVKNVVKYWMQQYKIDGFRFDLSKGFTQKTSSDDAGFAAYDASRVSIWKEYNNYIKSIDANNFYVILEHFAEANEEKVLADEGMMLWANINYNMNEATMGWLGASDFSWAFASKHGFAKSENLVSYMESHDEERLNFKNITYGNVVPGYSVKDLTTALKREELAAAFLFAVPGPKMIWQFGELGYDYSIDFNGRLGEKPIRWDYFDDARRKALYTAYAKFIKLKKNNAIFTTANTSYNLTGGIKYIKLISGSNTVMVVGNFDVTAQTANVDFGNNGNWIDAMNGTNINLATANYSAVLAPGEYRIYSRQNLN
ncbi:alpha-amylase family glycosyl hydrolase [Pedobacter sp. Hv1]|uniref:alpha-amylase family glycosyl hydrolase n=1 Tax=Pedobacter sp. Hv1 TaxID=1740090 RepID=UPI0006D8C421|nr:alpha-amylase family glycosyl hydrolase [Pedobacter sp. Hv1]KQB99776.1 alpha-amylase [Pedobacter sp. Hv1]